MSIAKSSPIRNILSVSYIKVSEIDSVVENSSTGTVTITLEDGKDFSIIEASKANIEFAEEFIDSPEGGYWDQRTNIFIPGDDIDNYSYLKILLCLKYVIKITCENGDEWLVGNKNNPVRSTLERSKNVPVGVSIRFTRKSAQPVLQIEPD